MGELRLPILYEIQNCLNYYGFENEIRNNTFYDPMSTSGHVAIELNESSFGMMRNSV